MSRWIGPLAIAIFLAAQIAAEDALPVQGEPESFAIEPPLLIQSRGPDGLPIVPVPPQSADVAKLTSDLARAKKRAAGAENLYRAGIIAKVEAEERALKVVRLQAALATAQLEEVKAKSAEGSAAPNESPHAPDETGLAKAEEAAQHATEDRHRAELTMALRNLERQQKLLALGSGRKADVNRAEQKLAELQRAEN